MATQNELNCAEQIFSLSLNAINQYKNGQIDRDTVMLYNREIAILVWQISYIIPGVYVEIDAARYCAECFANYILTH